MWCQREGKRVFQGVGRQMLTCCAPGILPAVSELCKLIWWCAQGKPHQSGYKAVETADLDDSYLRPEVLLHLAAYLKCRVSPQSPELLSWNLVFSQVRQVTNRDGTFRRHCCSAWLGVSSQVTKEK